MKGKSFPAATSLGSAVRFDGDRGRSRSRRGRGGRGRGPLLVRVVVLGQVEEVVGRDSDLDVEPGPLLAVLGLIGHEGGGVPSQEGCDDPGDAHRKKF